MIKSIEICFDGYIQNINFKYFENRIHLPEMNFSDSFSLKFKFKYPILRLRNHDYTWVKPNKSYLASELCPKILQLSNGLYIQANTVKGAWTISPDNTTLHWLFNQPYQYPYTQYANSNNQKITKHHKYTINLSILKLLATKHPLEFSRSKIGFTPVVCFTDHCDFDTRDNLKTIRTFFKKYHIKTTKGIFLNQFSKRETNASYETDRCELKSWEQDGHELAYHSLTQSIREKTKAFKEFENFTPLQNAKTWIDHGYQPYNFTLSQKNKTIEAFMKTARTKKISFFWTYIDNASAQKGILNQLDANSFSLNQLLKATQHFGFVHRWSLRIKGVLFYYYESKKAVLVYKMIASSYKSFKQRMNVKNLFLFLKQIVRLSSLVITPLLSLKYKNKIFPLSMYKPIVFPFINNTFLFQTVEINDFKNGLSNSNQNQLLKDKGFVILHTYFSVKLNYHKGRLLIDDHTVNPAVEHNFKILSHHIKSSKLWNPTLTELIEYMRPLFNSELTLDASNKVVFKEKNYLLTRYIK